MMPDREKTSLSLLRAPGLGLLTVSTGADAAGKLLKTHFRGVDPTKWSARLDATLKLAAEKPLLLGIPSDSGGGICRGAAHGPVHLREALFRKRAEWKKRDLGDVPCIPQLSHDSMLNERQLERSGRSLWGDAWRAGRAVSPLNILEEALVEIHARQSPARVMLLGGDHSVSGPVFAALARASLTRKLAVLHVDAHTDLLESRYGVEHCFGTWTAHAVKTLDDPSNWVQIGIRASGRDRAQWEKTYGLRQIWSADLRRQDPDKFARGLVEAWRARGCERLYVTCDIDGLDAGAAPATGTPEPKGLSLPWLRKVFARVTREMPLIGADMVEVAPVLGPPAAARKTLAAAVSLIEALEWN